MSRSLTPRSTLDNIRKEAKRWLKALRADDAAARARYDTALASAPASPTLRDVQLALAREYGFDGWTQLRREVERIARERVPATREAALEALLHAAGRNEVERVIALLDAYPDLVNERRSIDGSGLRTALHFGSGHEAVVRVLLERGADPNIRDEGDDATPLHFAAERGDLAIVKLLVEHGADPVGDGTHHALNVLGWAVCWDYVHNVEVAEYLLAHGAQHTIHTAVALGDVAAIRSIAARDPASIERAMDRTNLHRRPLHLAVVKQQGAALAALLELGADTEATDAAGLTALDRAALDGRAELADALIAHGAIVHLPAAVALGRTDDIDRLLREVPDALQAGSRYAALLVHASARGSVDVVERLIRAGAPVNVSADEGTAIDETVGYSPLHAAAFAGNLAVVRVLLAHGANPNLRERKYNATPAGWARYAHHDDVCSLILEADIDPFQAITFDVEYRIPEIVRRSPWLREKPFRDYAPWEPEESEWDPAPWHTPLVWAVVRGRTDAVRTLLELGAAPITAPDGRALLDVARDAGHEDVVAILQHFARFDETLEGRVRLFVKHACPDHDIRGPWHHAMAVNTATRLLRAQPDIATHSFCTSVICGDIAAVQRALAARPALANERGGPKEWEPLLYLCFTRLPLETVNDNAVTIATLLLDHGADPNVFFMAGHSRYSPLVGAIGEGEEDRPPHPRRDALVRLLLDRGAEPYDTQVIYNIHFHGRVLWFLKLMHEYALKLGRAADWDDPDWSMLNMDPYGSGARWHLGIAAEHDDIELAAWALTHGASPNAPPARNPRRPQTSLHEHAVRRGHHELAALLVQHGAQPADVPPDDEPAFVRACMRLDRPGAEDVLREHPEYLRATTVLFTAAEANRADVAALLLDLGVSPDVEDEKKQRALHVAAYADAVDVGRLLIERGAEIDPVEQNYGNTPLAAAVYAHSRRMIELLGRHSSELWNVTFTGNVDRLRELISEQPERARTQTANSETLLMWLPDDEARALDIIALLLAHGADAAIRSREGRTAADYAVRRGLLRAADRLRAAEQRS